MALDIIDVAKIIIAIASVVTIILFRRKIMNLLSGIMNGGDKDRYKDRPSSEILADAERLMNEVLG